MAEGTVAHSVLLSVTIDSSSVPAKFYLSWDNSDTNAESYQVWKKEKQDFIWRKIGIFDKSQNQYIDTNVQRGTGYEYKVRKNIYDTSYSGFGYIYSGFDLQMPEDRGKLLLFVDDSISNVLGFEINRFIFDLQCDGYIVKRYDVPRTETFYPPAVRSIKKIIDYEKMLSDVSSVILFGRVAVPYSGNTAWDGHNSIHSGAWPADLYYSVSSDYWTDSDVFNVNPDRSENKNIPFDGKFDESVISRAEYPVGRIDMFNLPNLGKSEIVALREYLDKDHDFKRRKLILAERGLIDDGFGLYGNEAFASNAWMNFASILGKEKIDTNSFMYTLRDRDYLWAYGCNSGSYESVFNIAYTNDLALYPQKAVFALLLGSFFGDWDTKDNLLRAITASYPSVLCGIWAGRPYWYLHHMGLGETVGYSALVTQNNQSTYEGTGKNGLKGAHVNLIGDPTLRMRYVDPPDSLTIKDDVIINGIRTINLSWKKSDDEISGYNIYITKSLDMPFTRVNQNLITTEDFSLNSAIFGKCYLMVRAVRLENTNSGSYFNLSLGDMILSEDGTDVADSKTYNQINISPNPVSDIFYITFDQNSIYPATCSIINSQGIELYKHQVSEFANGKCRVKIDLAGDLKNPPSGAYFIKLFKDNKFYLGKFLIIN